MNIWTDFAQIWNEPMKSITLWCKIHVLIPMHNIIGLGLWCLACGFVVVLFVLIMFLVHVYCVFNFYVYQMFLVYCVYWVYNVLSNTTNQTLIKTSKKINNVFGFNWTHQNMLGLAFVFWVLASCVLIYLILCWCFFGNPQCFESSFVLDVFRKIVVSVVCLCVIYSLCLTCIMYLCHMFCLSKCF
jgi:hypothetical protein